MYVYLPTYLPGTYSKSSCLILIKIIYVKCWQLWLSKLIFRLISRKRDKSQIHSSVATGDFLSNMKMSNLWIWQLFNVNVSHFWDGRTRTDSRSNFSFSISWNYINHLLQKLRCKQTIRLWLTYTARRTSQKFSKRAKNY